MIQNSKSWDWDLQAILEGRPFEELYNEWVKQQDALINSYQEGKCFSKLLSFKKYLQESLVFAKLSNRIWNFVENKLNEDITAQKWIGWQQKMQNQAQILEEKLATETWSILDNEKNIKKHLNSDSSLIKYKRVFESEFKLRKYMLSKNLELLWTKLSRGDFDHDELYQSVTVNDIKYQDILDSKNKKHRVQNEISLKKYLKYPDRVLRKNAWRISQDSFLNYQHTLSKLLYYNYLDLNLGSQIRGFKDYIHAQAYADEIDVSFISFVYEQVAKYANSASRFYRYNDQALIKKFKLKKIYPWDRELNLFRFQKRFSIPEAQNIALTALIPLGEDYLKRVEKVFAERWISWLPKPNKQTGAYSIGGIYGLNKFYIFLNYDYTLEALFSLVHEIGHSVHSTYLTQNQDIYCETDTFCAEIASITNEMLLNFYLLDKYQGDVKKLLVIYQEIISNFFATTTLQVMLSDFEWQLVDKLNSHEAVNSATIFAMYGKTFIKYLKSKAKSLNQALFKKRYRNFASILKIDHFYMGSFYVYKYAIGLVIGINLALQIYQKNEDALKRYLSFLKKGSSKDPLSLIKELGFDITNTQCWQQAHQLIDEYIKKYYELLKGIKLD
ncbi:M3 family metallopeptidase [[Mycoplasma] testudinis]|uniref:M3 family metallopeptidase n=1 Tax=[Mycoplasma] testudinis TaxID=33924 RepID=UPI000AB00AD4|nr:M3 family metallopeptidase [[Mycoplasma] testudinis]